MSRVHISAGVALLTCCGVAVLIALREEKTVSHKGQALVSRGISGSSSAGILEEPRWRDSDPPSRRAKAGAVPEGIDVEALRRELDSASDKLERVSRPLFKDVLSSAVRAEIRAGESLVTGGYRTADGNYELTFITPRSVRLDDGREAFDVEAHILSVGPVFVAAHGLESIATNARNTLQHAEAWKPSDVRTTLASATTSEGAIVASSPRILTLPSSPFTVEIGFDDGRGYSLEGTIEHSPDGGFSIESRIERQEEPSKSE